MYVLRENENTAQQWQKNYWDYTHVGFKSNKSMDLDFNNPDCSYSKIIPTKSNTKWIK